MWAPPTISASSMISRASRFLMATGILSRP
ncbi:hypothetical protein BN1723_019935 [Verticillium longisporum]|uniref:Uncharacterized protein n=1 Tax=Verticillium longisporum TaxID=100787 RepID=A0A0G4NIG3_VERLO|nr:hypothetical protein BN1723_019935 [Verticillium longisporum]